MAEPIHLQSPLARALADLVRTGRVSSVDEKKHTAQVQFFELLDDGEDFVTGDLNVLVLRPDDYSLPAPGADVLCLMIPSNSGIGYVLGALYSDAVAPPLSDKGQRSIAGDDIRLGAPDATDKVALAPAVKSELDKIKAELLKIQTAHNTHVHVLAISAAPGSGGTGTAAPPVIAYSPGYDPTEPKAEKVSAK